MSTSFNATPSNLPAESQSAARIRPLEIPATRLLYWSLRRELWENRAIYIAPLIAAGVFLFGFLINLILLRHRLHGMGSLGAAKQHELLEMPYELAAALIMGTSFIVGIFYSLDALYGERRDRSILFWKSLPVSDSLTVFSKFLVPLGVVPLISFAVAVVTQWLMLLLSSVVLLGGGISLATIWAHSSLINFSFMLLYHIVTVHGLWYAPIYGYFLLVSAWTPRAPFIWAFLPPFVICGVEKIAFNSTHVLNWLGHRLSGPENGDAPPGGSLMDVMAAMTPLKFLSSPGLWVGLAVAAAFLTAAVRLRRYRGPV
jgi:ABC-2 type transport system permease protein